MLETKTKLSVVKMMAFCALFFIAACGSNKSEKTTETPVVVKDTTVIDTTAAPRPLKPGN